MACITTVEELALRKHHDMFIRTGNCMCILDKLISNDLLISAYLDKIRDEKDTKTLNRLDLQLVLLYNYLWGIECPSV